VSLQSYALTHFRTNYARTIIWQSASGFSHKNDYLIYILLNYYCFLDFPESRYPYTKFNKCRRIKLEFCGKRLQQRNKCCQVRRKILNFKNDKWWMRRGQHKIRAMTNYDRVFKAARKLIFVIWINFIFFRIFFFFFFFFEYFRWRRFWKWFCCFSNVKYVIYKIWAADLYEVLSKYLIIHKVSSQWYALYAITWCYLYTG